MTILRNFYAWRIGHEANCGLNKLRFNGVSPTSDHKQSFTKFLWFPFKHCYPKIYFIKLRLAIASLRLYATGLSICLSVRLSVRPSVCRQNAYKNAIFSKTKQFRAMVSIDDLLEVLHRLSMNTLLEP